MSIELRQLRYAVLTADTQSFSRAAATLNVKQSTLSRRVLQLEDRLGVKLFERTTRGRIADRRHARTDSSSTRLARRAHGIGHGGTACGA